MNKKGFLKKYPVVGQFLRFGLIGGMNTGIDLVILFILMSISGITAGIGYAVFKTISFSAAATFSYFMNKTWAFKDNSQKKQVQKFSQFFTISIIGAGINVGTATVVVTYLKPLIGITDLGAIALTGEIWGIIGGLCGTAVGLMWNFLGYKFIVFKK
ncbi:MAG: GtrA family protein [Candidatus Moranbacteria bacterium]|nr:GtrA family protein [Candidatus Moranbacteria bacterium]